MNENVQKLADQIQQKFGLDNYVLKRNHIYYEKNMYTKPDYILTLEFFPAEYNSENNEDWNPDGTAVIDINLHTNEVRRIIFVNDVTYAKEGIFPVPNVEDIIEWVEEMTNLMFGRQFKLVHEGESDFRFQAAIDHIEVAPTGYIEVKFNDANQLTTFTFDGVFPTEEEVDWEPFSIMKEMISKEISEHFILTEIPVEIEEKWAKVWQINPFYIRNDQSDIILPEAIYQDDSYITVNKTLEWDEPSTKQFTTEDIDLSTELTYEEAMERFEVTPIDNDEIITCIDEVKEFMRSVYPDDSGLWTIYGMYPEKDYIFVELKGKKLKAFQRNLKVIVKRNSLQIVNYWDSKNIIDMYASFQESDKTYLNKEEALDKIIKYIEVTPVYVKTPNSEQYKLCARIDSNVVVGDKSGKLIPITELN